MRWIGLLIAGIGIFLYLSTLTFQQVTLNKAVKVQLTKNNEVISEPFMAILGDSKIIEKGEGKDGAQFLNANSEYVPYKQYERIFALAKAAMFGTVALGLVGFLFESWRIKTRRILET
jgi:hypothetical protein